MRTHIGVRPRSPRESQERVNDPYMKRSKMPSPAVCIGCGAVYQKGRWHWALKTPKGAARETCQACLRIEDDLPAGIMILRGAYLRSHQKEILALVRNNENAEMKDHPLHRIMNIEERRNSVIVRTTDVHLPARIGRALARAFKGELDLKFDEGANFVRVGWKRD